jgi:hypothetical protein
MLLKSISALSSEIFFRISDIDGITSLEFSMFRPRSLENTL